MEEMFKDVQNSEPNWTIIFLRIFNPIGSHKSGQIGEDPIQETIPSNLMPYLAKVAVGNLPYFEICGNDYDTKDGTGVRDYLHICDLADGCVKALEKAENTNSGLFTYNFSSGKGYTVLEVKKAFEKACGKSIATKFVGRRDGDVAEVCAVPKKAEIELGWKPKYSLEEMCLDHWRWQSLNPFGYAEEMK